MDRVLNFFARLLVAGLLVVNGLAPVAAQWQDQRNYAGTSGGAANAQTITIANMGSTVPPGVPLRFIPGFANTTTATLTVSGGSSAAAFCKPSPAGPTALVGGELQTTQTVEVIWNGTCYLITSSVDSTASSLVTPPQGYMTPCPAASPPTGCTAGQPVPTGNVTVGVAQTVTGIVYSPSVGGNRIPIYNGSSMVMTTFPELTLTLSSSHLANTLYDICVFNNSGTPTVATNVAWTTSTAGSGARGSGAGTAEIANVNGVWTNAVVMTGINGATTYSNIPANRCTMVATMLVSASNGVITFTRTYGQSRVWPLVNFYNKLPILLKVGDATATWSYTTASFRNSDNSSANSAIVLNPLTQEPLEALFYQSATFANTAANAATRITLNGTACGFSPIFQNSSGANNAVAFVASCNTVPTLGINTIQMQEQGTGTTGTWNGTETGNVMTAKWRG